jgi:hypothetical protein
MREDAAWKTACELTYKRMVETFEHRANRPNDAPHKGALTALGSPWDGRWKNHKDAYRHALDHYDETTVPACALGVIWFICGRPDERPYSLTEIARWAGLSFGQGAALVHLVDAGASWAELVRTLKHWARKERQIGRQLWPHEILPDLQARLRPLIPDDEYRELYEELAQLQETFKEMQAAKKPKAMPKPKPAPRKKPVPPAMSLGIEYPPPPPAAKQLQLAVI